MTIPIEHPPINVDGVLYGLAHLDAFCASIPGKGMNAGTDLIVEVVFSNHVYTERTKRGVRHHAVDHHGTRRTFDYDRYQMSKHLGNALRAKIGDNALTHVSKSYGGTDNLVFVEMDDGRTWAIVYCLTPRADSLSVRMEVLSAHPKLIESKAVSRRNLSYFARKCLYEKRRIPNA